MKIEAPGGNKSGELLPSCQDCVSIQSYTSFCGAVNVNQKEAVRITDEIKSFKLYAIFDNETCENVVRLIPRCSEEKKCEQPDYRVLNK